MKLLPYLKNRLKISLRRAFHTKKEFQIAPLSFATPQSVYRDCKLVFDTNDECDESGKVYYFREDVRIKTDESTLVDDDDTYTPTITFGEMKVAKNGDIICYEEFLQHNGLLSALEKILHTPFLVMLYDLDLNRGAYFEWYKRRVAKLKKISTLWLGKHSAEKLVIELERIGVELRAFCRDAMEFISASVMPHLNDAVENLRVDQRIAANQSILYAEAQYARVAKKNDPLNETLRNIKNIAGKCNEFDPAHIEKAGKRLTTITIAPFKA